MPYKDKEKQAAYKKQHSANRYAEGKISPKAYREYAWRQKGINMTWERFLQMFADQEGLCALCHNPITLSAHVDHDHETGEIRGLLHNKCNRGLGLFKTVNDLECAVAYLKKF